MKQKGGTQQKGGAMDKRGRILVDWQWKPDKTLQGNEPPQAYEWLQAFQETFHPNPLLLWANLPLSLGGDDALALIEAAADYPDIGLVLTTLLEEPIDAFLRKARLLHGRLFIVVTLDIASTTYGEVIERVLALRAIGIEVGVIVRPKKAYRENFHFLIDRFAFHEIPLLVMPPILAPREKAALLDIRQDIMRFAPSSLIRLGCGETSLANARSALGRYVFAASLDGELFASSRLLNHSLGNIFERKAKLSDTSRKFGLDKPLKVIDYLSLLSPDEPWPLVNPVTRFLKEGDMINEQGQVDYPLRFVDWEDEAKAPAFGTPPLRPKYQELFAKGGERFFRQSAILLDVVLRNSIGYLPILRTIIEKKFTGYGDDETP